MPTPSWECIHDTDDVQFACDGHVTNDPEVLSTLARAYTRESGDPLEETWELVVDVTLRHGYVGIVPGVHDYVTCDADGNWPGVDDGEPAATDVRPTTWAYLPHSPAPAYG